jgi:meso-butanediol dehydrogenase / (S,S)-butanediol dehydrogenase / diacetyl reductase
MMEAASWDLAGRAVIVTGGGTGIGRAAAHQFAMEGADVLVVGRTAARLQEAADGWPSIRTMVADVAAADAPAEIVAAALAAFGRIDVLVNNAAITRPAPLGAIDRAVAHQQLAVNLLGPLFLAQAALPHLEQRSGVIINITASPQQRGWPSNSVDGATNVALDCLTHTWAVELGPRGIRVVSVAPGMTETGVLARAGTDPDPDPERIASGPQGEGLGRSLPLGRPAKLAEIVWWIVNAARPQASYLTGSVVRVDGGAGAS